MDRCNQAIKDFEAAEVRFGNQILFVRANVDDDHRIRKYYNSHCEPAVTMCVYGRHFDKHIGVNLEVLEKKLRETIEFVEKSWLPNEIRFYEPYHEEYNQKYRDHLLEYKNSGSMW